MCHDLRRTPEIDSANHWGSIEPRLGTPALVVVALNVDYMNITKCPQTKAQCPQQAFIICSDSDLYA